MARSLLLTLVATAYYAVDGLVAPSPTRPLGVGRSGLASGRPRRDGGGAARGAALRATETEGEVFELLDEDGDAVGAPGAMMDAAAAAADDDDGDDETQQARVVTYMVLSLLPILALLPFFGSRDFLPADPSLYS